MAILVSWATRKALTPDSQRNISDMNPPVGDLALELAI
jgi:hypothetical protein